MSSNTRAQGGFCKRSCETSLISTVNDFAECLNQRNQCDILLFDFSFSKTYLHLLLYHKLSHYIVQGSLLSWLKSFFDHVILDNQKVIPLRLRHSSHPFIILNFISMIYLRISIQNKIILYADDVLYSRITSIADCLSLQQDLDILVQWANKWKMTINILKCEFLRVTNKHTYQC